MSVKRHWYGDCYSCLSGNICEDSDAHPSALLENNTMRKTYGRETVTPTQSKPCWPFFHKWSRWSNPTYVDGDGILFITNSRTCSKCGKVQSRTIQEY